jgi:hypothetical protein
MTMSSEQGRTALTPTYHEGPIESDGDVRLNRRWFTYETDAGLVAGSILNVMFTIDRPVSEVWPYFKDFNLWQNSYDHYYSEVVGDLDEGQTFSISSTPNTPGLHHYEVVRVIPEQTIVLSQPVPPDEPNGAPDADRSGESGTWKGHRLPGTGGVSPGFHVFVLTHDDGKTVITVMMQHASLMARGESAREITPAEAVDSWREIGADGVMKWRDIFIPNLKKIVYEAQP